MRLGALFRLGLGGLSLAELLRAESQANQQQNDHSIIMVYLPGGPTQLETFDPKPNAPLEIRGTSEVIDTCIPGVQFSEWLPKLAQTANTFSVVRTLTGMKNRHESFQCYTGRPGGRNGDGEPATGWPSLGSVVSYVQGPGRNGCLPTLMPLQK